MGCAGDGLHPRHARPAARARRHPQTTDGVAIDRQRHAAGDRGAPLFLYATRRHAESADALCRGFATGSMDRTACWSTPTHSPPTAPSRSTGFSPAKTESMSPMDFSQRFGDEHAAHHRNQNRHPAGRHHRAHTRCVASRGSSTTPASITRVIRKKAKSPLARKCTTGTFSITNSRTIPKTFLKTRSADLRRRPRSRRLAERASL